jgi:hypothetical protein
MKRLMPISLVSFLQTNPNCLKADLFAITLPTGTTIYVTEGQFDITVPSGTNGWTGSTTTFSSSQYGRWSRGAITSEAGFGLQSNTMSLSCVPQQGTSYPGMNVGILNAAFNGLFEPAHVTVYTAYMPSNAYGNLSNGIETKFYGTLEKITEINRLKVTFECADPLYALNLKVPTRVFQSNCPWSYGDSNCNPVGGIQTQSFTAASGSSVWTLIPSSAFSQAFGYFSQGVVKCTAGTNSGLSQTVKLHDASGNLEMSFPWLLTPNVGDTFVVTAGCDKTLPTCISKFANQVHFGGDPFIPPPTQAV